MDSPRKSLSVMLERLEKRWEAGKTQYKGSCPIECLLKNLEQLVIVPKKGHDFPVQKLRLGSVLPVFWGIASERRRKHHNK